MFYSIGVSPGEVLIWDSSDGTYGKVSRTDLKELIKSGVTVRGAVVSKSDTLELSYNFWYDLYYANMCNSYISTPVFSAIVNKNTIYYLYKSGLYTFDILLVADMIKVGYRGAKEYEFNAYAWIQYLFAVLNTKGVLLMSGGNTLFDIKNTCLKKEYSTPCSLNEFRRFALSMDNLKTL